MMTKDNAVPDLGAGSKKNKKNKRKKGKQIDMSKILEMAKQTGRGAQFPNATANAKVLKVDGEERILPVQQPQQVRLEEADIGKICDDAVNAIDRDTLKNKIAEAIREAASRSGKISVGTTADDKVLRSVSKGKKKLILQNPHSPGDVVMMTAAIRDLHATYPNEYKTDIRCSVYEIFEGNPFITKLDENDPDVASFKSEYPLIHQSNEGSYHFIHGYRKHLETCIGRPITQGKLKGDIYIRDEERAWYSAVRELVNDDRPYWIIDAGWKNDFTAKAWSVERYQAVVSHFRDKIQFVQIGHSDHNHAPLKGVINMIGKTDLRQLIRLVYHSAGIVTPVSLPMTLAAAVPQSMSFPKNRPCVVLSGGREPMQWQAYPNHRFLHTCGTMNCCDNGGCWKSRVQKLGDGDKSKEDSLCMHPSKVAGGQVIAECMARIESQDVIEAIESHYREPGAVLKYHESKTVEVVYGEHNESKGTESDIKK